MIAYQLLLLFRTYLDQKSPFIKNSGTGLKLPIFQQVILHEALAILEVE